MYFLNSNITVEMLKYFSRNVRRRLFISQAFDGCLGISPRNRKQINIFLQIFYVYDIDNSRSVAGWRHIGN